MKTKQIVFEEYIIDNGVEIPAVSRVYFKQSKKMAIEKAGGKAAWRKMMQMQIE